MAQHQVLIDSLDSPPVLRLTRDFIELCPYDRGLGAARQAALINCSFPVAGNATGYESLTVHQFQKRLRRHFDRFNQVPAPPYSQQAVAVALHPSDNTLRTGHRCTGGA